jgi:hypothetical protein
MLNSTAAITQNMSARAAPAFAASRSLVLATCLLFGAVECLTNA